MVKNRIDALEDFRKQLEGADVDLLREMVKVFAEQLWEQMRTRSAVRTTVSAHRNG